MEKSGAGRAVDGGGRQDESPRAQEMIWFAWFMLALESLVIAIGLWLMWAMVSEASGSAATHSSCRGPASNPPNVLLKPATTRTVHPEEVDERGYVGSRKLHMGCEAAICRIPLGARIIAGRRSLKEPQYAWDYASVRLADKALAYAEFSTHPRRA